MYAGKMTPDEARLMARLNARWEDRWGYVLGTEALQKVLSFRSAKALGKAISRGELGLAFFEMPNRRGHFLLTEEAAYFVARQRAAVGNVCPAAADEKKGGTDMS
jgi:hypothetical protein